MPTFASAPSVDPASSRRQRETLLPTDCVDALPGVDLAALLGQPMDSIQTRTVVGVDAPSVGRLERVNCLSRRTANRGGPVDLDFRLSAYTDADAADRHTRTNVAAERASSRAAEEFAIGSARAVLLAQRGQSVLMVSNGRSAVTMTLRQGVVADDQTRPVMVDLVQRLLPNLAPERAAESR